MPVPSRTTFYERLSAYRDALLEPTIVSREPAEVAHNAKARLFRNGLAVMGFAILEDFLRTRIGEVLERIGHGHTAFADLPEPLRTASTIGVIDGIRFNSTFLERPSGDYYAYIQNHSQAVASTATAAYRISPLAFARDRPNVQPSDIESILNAFQINQPWTAIQTFSHRAGTGILAPRPTFQEALDRRNRAAHRADSDVEFAELDAFLGVAATIGAGVDLLLSHSLRKILDRDVPLLTGQTLLAMNHVGIRFISKNDQFWREVVNANVKAFRRDTSLGPLKAACIARAAANNQAVVVKDDSGKVAEWFTPVVD
jgi:hypothetical protein